MSARGRGRRSLGINTSIVSTSRENDRFGEVIDDATRARESRKFRHKRLMAIRQLLPNDRTSKCLWVQIARYVEIWKTNKNAVKSVAHVRAHYRGVMTCGSIWTCPVCAAKISERRRIELRETIDAARARGLSVLMVTLTLQHNRREVYKDLVEVLRLAWRKMQGGRWWGNFKSALGLFGHVTSLEFTVSLDNGGHPHLHVLIFVEAQDVDVNKLRELVSARYTHILKKLGRYAHHKHGVLVQTGDDAVGDYIAKYGGDDRNAKTWGLDAEMTKGLVKSGLQHGEHYTPFQLLDLYMLGNMQAGRMFVQYVEAFKGRNQLTGLTQLRRRLGLDASMTDEEIAEAGEADSAKFVTLDGDGTQWRRIRERGGEVLDVASVSDYRTFRDYMARQFGIMLDD